MAKCNQLTPLPFKRSDASFKVTRQKSCGINSVLRIPSRGKYIDKLSRVSLRSINPPAAINFSCQGQKSRSNMPTFIWLIELSQNLTNGFQVVSSFLIKNPKKSRSKIKVKCHPNIITSRVHCSAHSYQVT